MNADKQGRLISLQWLTSSVFCLAKAQTSGTLGMWKGEVGLRGNGLELQEVMHHYAVAERVRWSGWQEKMDRWMNDQARWDIYASVPSKRITFKGSHLMFTKIYSEGIIWKTSDEKDKKGENLFFGGFFSVFEGFIFLCKIILLKCWSVELEACPRRGQLMG